MYLTPYCTVKSELCPASRSTSKDEQATLHTFVPSSAVTTIGDGRLTVRTPLRVVASVSPTAWTNSPFPLATMSVEFPSLNTCTPPALAN